MTNGSGCGFGRPKNIRIRIQIRIPNTAKALQKDWHINVVCGFLKASQCTARLVFFRWFISINQCTFFGSGLEPPDLDEDKTAAMFARSSEAPALQRMYRYLLIRTKHRITGSGLFKLLKKISHFFCEMRHYKPRNSDPDPNNFGNAGSGSACDK